MRVRVGVSACVHACVHVCMRVRVCACACVHACARICVCRRNWVGTRMLFACNTVSILSERTQSNDRTTPHTSRFSESATRNGRSEIADAASFRKTSRTMLLKILSETCIIKKRMLSEISILGKRRLLVTPRRKPNEVALRT